jgi:hypothetical protein
MVELFSFQKVLNGSIQLPFHIGMAFNGCHHLSR